MTTDRKRGYLYILLAAMLYSTTEVALKALGGAFAPMQVTVERVLLGADIDAMDDETLAQAAEEITVFAKLSPAQKARVVTVLRQKGHSVGYMGDGINDAPVLALSHVGIAMGGLGSDAAIETADVVIQTDQPSRVATAIHAGRQTRRIVWQNISLAFGVKLLVLILGAGGIATLWEAVFADVGVALIAIVNAIRIQKLIK